MAGGGMTWRSIVWCAGIFVLCTATYGYTQFTSFNDRRLSMLEGNWQSCREEDGSYTERVYDGTLPGAGTFELHMGPNHEFAFFRGIQEEHRDHASANNLLKPYTVDVTRNVGRQTWRVAGLRLDVSLAGGSRTECESWWVQLGRADTTSPY